MQACPHLRLTAALVLPLLFLAAIPAHGSDEAKQAALAAEDARRAALIADDFAALARLFDEELVYIHATGRVENRQDVLDTLRSGRLKYLAITGDAPDVRVFGSTAALVGTAHFDVRAGEREIALDVLFTALYIQREGDWKLFHWQNTRLPESVPTQRSPE